MATRLPDIGLRGYQNPARTVTTGSIDSATSLNIAGTDSTQPMEFTVHNGSAVDNVWVYVGGVQSVMVVLNAISAPIQLGASQSALVLNSISETPSTITITGTNVTVTGGL